MHDVLPRFADGPLRMRLGQLEPGKELSILVPQAIVSAKKYPGHRQHNFTDNDLRDDRGLAPSVKFGDFVVDTVRDWLNSDPLLWCQYGARLKLNKMANTYTLTLYPYPPI